MSKIILKGYIVVPDAELDVVKHELINHIELTRQESGCLIFEVSQNEENHNRFDVYEEFINQDSFIEHQSRVSKSKWGEITKKIERHYRIINTV